MKGGGNGFFRSIARTNWLTIESRWNPLGHQCILSRKYFPIASLDRDKSENHNDICFMAFALKGTVLLVLAVAVIT